MKRLDGNKAIASDHNIRRRVRRQIDVAARERVSEPNTVALPGWRSGHAPMPGVIGFKKLSRAEGHQNKNCIGFSPPQGRKSRDRDTKKAASKSYAKKIDSDEIEQLCAKLDNAPEQRDEHSRQGKLYPLFSGRVEMPGVRWPPVPLKHRIDKQNLRDKHTRPKRAPEVNAPPVRMLICCELRNRTAPDRVDPDAVYDESYHRGPYRERSAADLPDPENDDQRNQRQRPTASV